MSETEPAARTPWAAGRLSRGGRTPRLLFGWSYEDERVELDVFGDPGRVLVIAASGETAAACAAAGHEVLAVDINPVQLGYARQRIGGGRTLTGDAERLIGVGRSALATLAPAWRVDALTAGLLTRPPHVAAAYWRDRLDRVPASALLAATLRPGAQLARLLRPAFADFVPPQFDRLLRVRIAAGLARFGGAGNRFAWRLFAGQDLPGWRPTVVPPGGTLDWVEGDVLAVLEAQDEGSLTGISLSNVTDGVSAEYADRLHAAARRALVPGAAVVSRSFVTGPMHHHDAGLLWGTVRVERTKIRTSRPAHPVEQADTETIA